MGLLLSDVMRGGADPPKSSTPCLDDEASFGPEEGITTWQERGCRARIQRDRLPEEHST